MDPESFAELLEYYSLKKAEVLAKVKSNCSNQEIKDNYEDVRIDLRRTMMQLFPAKEFVNAIMDKFDESITETINQSSRDISL